MMRTLHRTLVLSVSLLVNPLAHASCLNNVPAQNPDHAYQVHADGTATDLRTGLMWKRCSEGQNWTGTTCAGEPLRRNWSGAIALGVQSRHGGYTDWRLPNVKELGSLVEKCRNMPAINISIFPNTPLTPNPAFWTSSPTAGNDRSSWFIGFDLGYSLRSFRSSGGGALVRLVRDAD